MKGYGQFCPIAKAAEILAERWTLLVARELVAGSCHYNDIRRGVPRMSPTLLARRLKQLEAAGVIERLREDSGPRVEYRLTQAGLELRPVLMSLAAWGHRWGTPSRQDLDPGFLMWSIRRCILAQWFPAKRTVIYVEFADRVALKRWWLIVADGEVDLCIKDHGHEVDLSLYTDLKTLTLYFDSRLSLTQAKSTGLLRLTGAGELVRGFAQWLQRPSPG